MDKLKLDCIELLSTTRATCPLIHNITNYVTVNDCANAVLAIGASPIMADDILEAEEIASISSALVINIGTLNSRTIESMLAAGKKANELNIPVILDPVGAGASTFRNNTVKRLLSEIKLAVLRGNLSEISFIAGISASTKGVDASEADAKNDAASIAIAVAKKFSCVVGITGAIDVVADKNRLAKISNGTKLLSKVTGTGCMTSALVGSFCGASKLSQDYFTATVAGITAMGISGEVSLEKINASGSNSCTGSFHVGIIDALSLLEESFSERAKIDEI